MAISSDKLEKTLMKTLEEWKDVSIAEIEKVAEIKGKELLKRVKRDSPKRTGEYQKGWRLKKEGFGTGKFKCVVYNKDKANLTMLLEHGHAKRNGGRTNKFPHLLQNEEDVTNEFVEEVEKIFK